jgi:hypothetical protein
VQVSSTARACGGVAGIRGTEGLTTISVLRRTVTGKVRPEHNNLIRVDAGIKSASQKQSSERASGLEMWLTTLSRSVQGRSRFR